MPCGHNAVNINLTQPPMQSCVAATFLTGPEST